MPVPDGDSAPQPGLWRDTTFMVAMVIAVVVALGFGLVVPVLPLFAESFGVGVFAASLVISLFSFVRLVSNVYTGALTQRMGSRRAVGWGAIIVAVSSLLTAGSPTYLALLLVRGAGGFGSALFFNSLLTLVIRAVPAGYRGRAVGALQSSFLFGIMFGPIIGGILSEPLGLRWPFAIYAVFCGAAGVVALLFLPREAELGGDPAAAGPTRPRGIVATWDTTRRLCADPAFLAALVMMGASRWSAQGVRVSLVPLFAADIGISRSWLGVALALGSVTHLLAVWPAGKIADTVGRKALATPAYAVFAVFALVIGWATSLPWFLAAMAAYGVGTGLTSVSPPAVAGDVVPVEDTGIGVGVLNTAGDLGSVLGPIVSGALAEWFGYTVGFGSAALLLAVAAGFALRMRETLPTAAAVR